MVVQQKTRNGGRLLLGVAAAIMLALLMQHALVDGAARLLADLWVSTVAVVLKLFASIFGAR